MSKAVLVMNMPGKCEECNFSNPDGDWCLFHGEVSYSEYAIRKPDDCPLKPLSVKMILSLKTDIGERKNNMKNFGLISKKKVAREIAKIYNDHENVPCSKEQFLRDCEVQSALNFLCSNLNIKPMHLSKLGGGTGEMIGGGE